MITYLLLFAVSSGATWCLLYAVYLRGYIEGVVVTGGRHPDKPRLAGGWNPDPVFEEPSVPPPEPPPRDYVRPSPIDSVRPPDAGQL